MGVHKDLNRAKRRGGLTDRVKVEVVKDAQLSLIHI